ncbi:MAG: tetratricopeptide repeat protein [Burkholderiaceae bacterium]
MKRVSEQTPVTFLFTDIEGSTRLWEQQPERMPLVMARHDAISRSVVERNRGTIVKMTGDGVHAAFDRPLDALIATLDIQQQLSTAETAGGLPLPLRCGLHAGIDERRDGDFYGRSVNRAARIMCTAHGGQMLMSRAVAEQVDGMLPNGASLRDLGVVRLRDLSTPEHIFQLLHPQLRADFPALRSLEGTPNNLTQQLNSFIGRERELAEIREMLESNRLVTLLGMGGIGKSRLSTQLAADVLDDFPDGVWFVELAALSDPNSVPQAVASVVGVKEEVGRPVIEALTKYVRELQLLIILDNCEQVVHGCADLAKRLLQAGPKVKILTSSRDYLQVAGETTYHLSTLSVPDIQQKTDVRSLIQHEAVRLFVDRASAARQAFGLNEDNASSVVDICRRLDGIPLAIELAAARIRALSPEAIAARLHDRFRLLVTADQTVLPRQRTLRALIDWSYDLLTEAERTIFQRLSVFAGGWTLAAAEAVCAAKDLRLEEVLDLLICLVEKSLVVLEVSGDRYRMLDTVRHYAHEKLAECGDETAVRARHLTFFLELAEGARPELAGPEQGIWLSRLDLDHENLLSANAWSESLPNSGELGLRLVHALRPYWIYRGVLTLGFKLSADVLARSGLQERNEARCRALAGAGQMLFFMGREAEAKAFLSESLAIAREIGSVTWVAAVLQPLGMACVADGDIVSARNHLEEAVTLAQDLGNKRELSAALNALAMLHRAEGSLDQAQTLHEKSLTLARALGERTYIAGALLSLAMLSITRSANEVARKMLTEALSIAEETRSAPTVQSALEVCAGLAAAHEDWLIAARFFGAAEALAKQVGLRRDPADHAFLAPLINTAKQALDRSTFSSAESLGQALTSDQALSEARKWLNEWSASCTPLTC